jgi:DNA segregation ATPase FtsK/SpoIIIE-like protein
MKVRLRAVGGDAAQDWEVEVGKDSTVRELGLRLFGPSGEHGLVVEGEWIGPDILVGRSGILDGAEVTARSATLPPVTARLGAGWELVAVAGPGAGRRVPVPTGDPVSLLVDPFDGPLIRAGYAADAVAELVVSVDGVLCTWAAPELIVDGDAVGEDGVLRPGAVMTIRATTARLTRTGDTRSGLAVGVPAEGQATVPFHRTARPVRPPAPAAVAAPDVPREPAKASPFNWAALGAPLVFAGVMFSMTQQATFALMSSLGAVIVLFSFVESRLRRRRDLRRNAADRQRELADFSSRLADARLQELRRRWEITPVPADCVRAADGLSPSLWERGPTDSDFLDAFAAVGHRDWMPAVERADQAGSETRQRVAQAGGLAPVPLTFSLDRGELVTLRGARPEVLGLARALICQVCCGQGPAHVRLGLLVEATADWEWLKWLPHLRDEVTGALRVELIDATHDPERAFDEAAGRLTAPPPPAGTHGQTRPGPDPADRAQAVRTLLIVDGSRLRPGSSLAFRRALAADASAIIIGGPPPNLTTTLVEIGPDNLVTQSDARTGKTVSGAALAPLPAQDAYRCVRTLARLDDPLVAHREPPLPADVRLSMLVPFDLAEPTDRLAAAVRADWSTHRDRGSLAVPIGLGESGYLEIDIVRHGPHGLIGGATGSGKSELLKMIVAGLAARYPPDEVIVGLFDFKGGTSLQELTRLPHCVGLVSDTDLHEAERALRYLRTELLRRERLLVDHGVQKIEQMPGGLPRLIVIIDEFQILADELPDELQTIIDLTKRGRSLGVHLLFATQSPASVRNYDEIKRNTQLRMTLKLLDVEDSVRLIDLPDAARFTVPGRGLARIENRVLAFQAGYPSGPVEVSPDGALRLVPFALLPGPAVGSQLGATGAITAAGGSQPASGGSTGAGSGHGASASGGRPSGPAEFDGGGAADWWTQPERMAEPSTQGIQAVASGTREVDARDLGARDWWTEDEVWWRVDEPPAGDPAASVGPTGAAGFDNGGHPDPELTAFTEHTEHAEHTELTALIAGVRLAYQSARQRGELRPVADVWPPALPESLGLDEIVAQVQTGEVLAGPPGGIGAYFARGDRPEESEHAKQPAVAWHLDAGNVLVFGAPASGASTALTALATSLAATMSPAELHIYVLDYAGGALRELATMPHCAGNVILGEERERQANLLAYLRARAARMGSLDSARRAGEAQSVLLIDNLAGFMNAHETVSSKQGVAVLEDFVAVFGAGPAAKVAVAASVTGTRVRNEVAARAPQRLILRLPDRNAYAELNIERRAIPRGVPGRGLWTTGNDILMEVQVASADVGYLDRSGSSSSRRAASPGGSSRLPSLIRALPTSIEPSELTASGGARMDGPTLMIPVGLSTEEGAIVQVCLELAEDSPALVYGPPKCGKSTLLCRLAELTRASLGDAVAIYASAPAGSPLSGCQVADRVREDVEAAVTLATRAAAERRPALLLIDDVTRLGDSLNAFLLDRHPQVRLVAAARTGELRSADYASTASRLKSAQTRLVLEPEPAESDPVSGRYFSYPPSGPGRGRGFLLSASGTRFVQI